MKIWAVCVWVVQPGKPEDDPGMYEDLSVKQTAD